MAEWVRHKFPQARVIKDCYLHDIGLLSDIYYEADGLKGAIEVQCRHIPPERLLERRKQYKEAGIVDLWIFIRKGDFVPGSPYERHYYRSNHRELYYLDTEKRMFTYYKGLKKDKFEEACTKLIYNISFTCPLSNVSFKKDGSLVLPGSREIYKQKLLEERLTLHEKIRKDREFTKEWKNV